MGDRLLRKAVHAALLVGGIALGLGALGASTPALAACSNPAGNAGEVIWNTTSNTPTYCNDTNWVSFAKGGNAISWFTAATLPSLVNPSPNTNDYMGRGGVSISGNLAAVGVPDNAVTFAAEGSVYVYALDTGALVSTLVNPNPTASDYFGYDTEIDGNLVVVGAPDDDAGGSGAGQAYVFNATTGALVSTLVNPNPTANDSFGGDVDISGNLAIVGARFDDPGGVSAAGQAYVFNATTGALVSTLVNPSPTTNDYFGVDVAISGNWAIVAAPDDDPGGLDSAGSVYVFDANTGALLHTLTAPVPAAYKDFGSSVAADGDRLIVGMNNADVGPGPAYSAGAAYIYNLNTGALVMTIENPEPEDSDNFGYTNSVAIYNGMVAVGAYSADPDGVDGAGKVHLFNAESGAWLGRVTRTNKQTMDFFGQGIALGDNILAVPFQKEMVSGLSNAGTVYVFEPSLPVGAEPWTNVGMGYYAGCGTRNGQLYCWGQNDYYATGLGTSTGLQTTPARVGTDTTWDMAKVAAFHSCGINNGALYCWGGNASGRTGMGTTSGDTTTPTQVGAFTNWTYVDAEYSHSCALRGTGLLYCWGSNTSGRTGLGTTSGTTTTPTQVGAFTDWTWVATGNTTTCGIRAGALYCWGSQFYGKLGNGLTSGSASSPVQIGSDTDWTDVSASWAHTCGIRGGALYCWGQNGNGKTGLGTTSGDQTTPAQVGVNTDWIRVSVGASFSCGLRAGGQLYCWGSNFMGRTGLNTNAGDQLTPAQVGAYADWSDLSVEEGASCALRNSGTMYCWGTNANGVTALGIDGITTGLDGTWVPTLVGDACAGPVGNNGDITYNPTDHVLQYCAGGLWLAAGPPGDGGAGCSNPSGSAGHLVYNSTHNVLQYCEGDTWVALGRP